MAGSTVDRDTPLGGSRLQRWLPIPAPDVHRFLLPDEQLRYVARKHPIRLVRPAAELAAVWLLGGFLLRALGRNPFVDLIGVLLGFAVLRFLIRCLIWSRTVLVATNRRVFEARLLITSQSKVLPVFRQSVVFQQEPIGRALNFGTVLVQTPAGERVHTFHWLRDPQRFYEAVTDRAV